MTDRGRAALRLAPETLEIGPSSLHWDGQKLIIRFDELAWPHGHRLRGEVVLRPHALTTVEAPLKDDGSHVWRPFAPSAAIEVSIDRPGWQWSGHGYFDANFGTSALEDDFRSWTWGRFPTPDGAVTFYDAERRDGSGLALSVHFDNDGTVQEIPGPPLTPLPRSRWLVARETRADPGTQPKVLKNLLDAPFYVRSMVETMIDGHKSLGVHEALDLDRFASPLIKPMLACKVPRRAHWLFRSKTSIKIEKGD